MLIKILALLLGITILGETCKAQVLINELMQSNIDCIMDDQNEFPDSWVELYNAGSNTVNLNQYLIGTKLDGSDAWQLPSFSLSSQSHTIVYCDKKASKMHASFRLDPGKDCTVYLFDKNMTMADSVHIEQKQPAPNISYGRKTSGSEDWGYQYIATPHASNIGTICSDILGEPIFSEPGRVMTSSQTINLALSIPEGSPEGTEIRYTTNGDEPTTSSSLYSATIKITGNMMIRAKLFCTGYLSPRSTTHSYLFLGREMTLPVVSIVTKNSYFKDSKIGILVNGSYSYNKKNYEYNWRRPINFEFFTEADSTSEINVLCETRVAGAASRGCSLKSMALYTHKRFGQKHFKYEFFPDQRPGQTHYKSFLLRNAGNDFDYLYMRDAIIQRSFAEHVDLDWQAWRPAIVFINGIYKGILNFRERSNEDNIYSNYNDLEDIDMVENWRELKKGSIDSFNEFSNFYNEHNHTWDEYAERMELEEYINLMIMNLYYNNQDFPGNNFMMWRPSEEGGRWRFIAKDTDFGLGLYGSSNTYKTLEWLYNPNYDYNHNWANQYDHTRLFRRLMEIPEFEREFIDRAAIYMGDFLNYDAVWKIWKPMYEETKTEYPHHRKLINEWWPNYQSELSSAQNWLKGRTEQFYSQLRSYYQLGAAMKLYINKDIPEEELEPVDISMNGVVLSAPRFNGKFFIGRDLTISANTRIDEDGQPISSRTVTSWRVDTYTSPTNYTTENYPGNTCHFVMPGCFQIVITPQYGESEGLEELTEDNSSAPTLFYDLNGRPLNQLHPGINIVRDGQGRTHKIIM